MSKALKKLIDINRLREFKNKLVGTDSAYVQTGAVDQTVAGTKAFSEPIVGSVTGSSGSCTGNAASATKLATARTIALSGAATGTATGFDGSGNITIPVTSLDASKLTGTASVSTTGNAATATTAANADHATSADSATRATSADRASAANCVQSQTSDYHEITFDWDSQVSGYVGLRVDATDMGGIVTTNKLVSAIRAHILSMVYPVGSVYISVNDVSPAAFLGGTWEKISQGRVLQGASDTQTAGTEVSAGLPNISVSSDGAHTHTRGSMNITGSVTMHGTNMCTDVWDPDGAFSGSAINSTYSGGSGHDCIGGASSVGIIGFSADRTWTGSTSSDGAHSHDAYITDITGKSTTVQPPALLVNIWKRTA